LRRQADRRGEEERVKQNRSEVRGGVPAQGRQPASQTIAARSVPVVRMIQNIISLFVSVPQGRKLCGEVSAAPSLRTYKDQGRDQLVFTAKKISPDGAKRPSGKVSRQRRCRGPRSLHPSERAAARFATPSHGSVNVRFRCVDLELQRQPANRRAASTRSAFWHRGTARGVIRQ